MKVDVIVPAMLGDFIIYQIGEYLHSERSFAVLMIFALTDADSESLF